ncbi:MAG: hypothetical protein ACR2F0_08035 [Chthoniobacterales bacterium]
MIGKFLRAHEKCGGSPGGGQLGLTRPGRLRGGFLFLGPTGVGKTEATLAFREFLMSRGPLFRFNLSEYQTQEGLALLLGGNARDRGTLGGVVSKSANGTGAPQRKGAAIYEAEACRAAGPVVAMSTAGCAAAHDYSPRAVRKALLSWT